jgi:hypothetical protein
LCGAENWTFRKGDQKYLNVFQMWHWRRMEKIIQTDRARNYGVIQSVMEQRDIVHNIKKEG